MSFFPVPGEYVLLMSLCFNSSDFPLFDKLTDITIEPSTLFVESTDWVFSVHFVCISHWDNLIIHLLNVLHQSHPFSSVTRSLPYSCFIDLLCELLMMTSHNLHKSGLAINTMSSVNVCLVVITRILLALSRLVPIRARFLVLKSQVGTLKIPSESSPSASKSSRFTR